MSDQLRRLWDKLELDIPEGHCPYFKSRHISLLQWVWQNRQLQVASGEDHFIQQCIRKEDERLASARVDIMVEAQQLGFELPEGEPSVTAFCAAVVWWGQQLDWYQWLEKTRPKLERLAYPESLPVPNFTSESIGVLKGWLTVQEGHEEIVAQIKSKAEMVAWTVPEFELPYDLQQITEVGRLLKQREKLWADFKEAEKAALDIEWKIFISSEERTDSRLKSFRAEIKVQKGLRSKVLVINQQLLERNAKAIPMSMPISIEVVEQARSKLEFHNQCLLNMAKNARDLLPWYRNKVQAPEVPFEREAYRAYEVAVKPYLLRSRFLRRSYKKILVLLVVMVLFFQGYYYMKVQNITKSAQEMGWDLKIEGPFYTPGLLAEYSDLVDSTLKLQPTVERLNERYAFHANPPFDGEQIRFAESFHKGVVVIQAGRFESKENPGLFFSIPHFLAVTQSEITVELWNELVPGFAIFCQSQECFDIAHPPCEGTCPVVGVSWLQVAGFANGLSQKMGLPSCYSISGSQVKWLDESCDGWRLPTEAEWLHAASDELGSNEVALVPIDQSTKNSYALLGMTDNAHEWVWDVHDDWPSGDHIGYRGPEQNGNRVVRGGDRTGLAPVHQSETVGFRLVRTMIDREN